MRDLILLCTKNVHFTFNNDIYKQTDGVTMSSPLSKYYNGWARKYYGTKIK